MIVATSRLDVAQSAGALDTVKPWRVGLEAEHYGQAERRRLYRTRIDALPRKLQALAKESEGSVLAELATPLEIQKFFDALPTLDDKERRNRAGFVAEAIRRAHQDSIERTVVDQIEERGDVRAAAVLWGLLKANDKLSLRLLREIEELLAESGPQFEKGVSPLVTFFVAARNLRQAESTITYYHPRVEAGIEQALDRDRLVARRTEEEAVSVSGIEPPDEVTRAVAELWRVPPPGHDSLFSSPEFVRLIMTENFERNVITGSGRPNALPPGSRLSLSRSSVYDYDQLFRVRSAFLHGRSMGAISTTARVLARRLARQVVAALVDQAATGVGGSRED